VRVASEFWDDRDGFVDRARNFEIFYEVSKKPMEESNVCIGAGGKETKECNLGGATTGTATKVVSPERRARGLIINKKGGNSRGKGGGKGLL